MPTSIGRDEVQRLVAEEQAQVVDVLPRAEYEWAHLAGAINLHLKQLTRENAAARLDPARPVIFYCNDYQ
jgi:rhodanese-related sulfurtransferase